MVYPEDSNDEKRALERTIKQGAFALISIAPLALIHAVIILTLGYFTSLTIGLGATAIAMVFAEKQVTSLTVLIVSLVSLGAVALFSFLGYCAVKRRQWAFTLGMLLYSLDALFLILLQDWYGILFHLLILFFIFRGFNAASQYQKL